MVLEFIGLRVSEDGRRFIVYHINTQEVLGVFFSTLDAGKFINGFVAGFNYLDQHLCDLGVYKKS